MPLLLRAGRFQFETPELLFSRLRLFEDHVALSGWHLHGRYRRHIPLSRILQVDVPAPNRLLLWLSNGEVVRLHVHDAPSWQQAIEANRYVQ